MRFFGDFQFLRRAVRQLPSRRCQAQLFMISRALNGNKLQKPLLRKSDSNTIYS